MHISFTVSASILCTIYENDACSSAVPLSTAQMTVYVFAGGLCESPAVCHLLLLLLFLQYCTDNEAKENMDDVASSF